MGCFSSKSVRVFVATNRKGQGADALIDFRKLGLSDAEVDRFWTVFLQIDTERSGQIKLKQFYRYFNFGQLELVNAAFKLFDEDGSGKIDFREFVISVWNFCSYNPKNLGIFAFSLFDHDNSNVLDIMEVRNLVDSVYGENHGNQRVERVLKLLDADGNGQINLQEFILYNKKYPILLYPAFQIQSTIRRKVLGDTFWKKAEVEREKKFRQKNIFEIVQNLSADNLREQVMRVTTHKIILEKPI